MLPSRTLALIFLTLTTRPAGAQTASDFAPYLFRLEFVNAYSDSCVLLQKSGLYHIEVDHTGGTKVFEGSLPPDQLQQVTTILTDIIRAVSARRIEEPLIVHRELLKLDIANQGRWSDITFLSAESQEPYRNSLQPILRWLNGLHKLPHKEFSEEAGRNNCLVPRQIALKKRTEQSHPSPNAASGPTQAPSPPELDAPLHPKPLALLRMKSVGISSGVLHEDCVLVVDDGSYRAENRSQKTGSKKVDTQLHGGRLTTPELSQLQNVLSDPALAGIRHRETSHAERPVMGEMLELQITRASELQDIILSTMFKHQDVPYFYYGDGDIVRAQPLLRFLAEHVNNNGLGSLDPQQRNGCSDAP